MIECVIVFFAPLFSSSNHFNCLVFPKTVRHNYAVYRLIQVTISVFGYCFGHVCPTLLIKDQAAKTDQYF